MGQDLAIVERKFIYLFQMILSPLFVILATILLYYRMGIWGILGIIILFFSYPL